MNSIVEAALKKLIQDDTFRDELAGMLDGVNRAADTMVSRNEQTEEQATPAETQDTVREEVANAEVNASKFSDIKDELLHDPTFLKELVNALMAATSDEERAARTALQESIDTLSRSVKELNATVTEHDSVITSMAEKALIAEGEKVQTFRARQPEKAGTAEEVNANSNLEQRAARVLTRMGGSNA